MKRPVAWFNLLTTAQQDTLRQMIFDSSLTYAEVAEAYGKTPSDISYVARAWGAAPRRAKREVRLKKPQGPQALTALTAVDRELEQAAAQLAATQQRLKELQAKRAELSVRFERDGADVVLVYGVTVQPLRATTAEWMQWLNAEGARKLREYITGGGK